MPGIRTVCAAARPVRYVARAASAPMTPRTDPTSLSSTRALPGSEYASTSSSTLVKSSAIGKWTSNGWTFGAHAGTSGITWSSLHSPGRDVGPLPHGFERPRGALSRVAGGAGIRHSVPICHGRGNKPERVAPDTHRGDRLGDLRHVAGHARAAGAVRPMVRVLLERATRAGLQLWPVTL